LTTLESTKTMTDPRMQAISRSLLRDVVSRRLILADRRRVRT